MIMQTTLQSDFVCVTHQETDFLSGFLMYVSVHFQKTLHTLHRGPWAIVVLRLHMHLTSAKLVQWSLVQFYFFFDLINKF